MVAFKLTTEEEEYIKKIKAIFDASTEKYIQSALANEFLKESIDFKHGFYVGAKEMSDTFAVMRATEIVMQKREL